MKSKTKAKFFCENCGAEVPEDARLCKHCGKFFVSVRCPKCGATGSHKEFEKGCPNCGYAVSKETDSGFSVKSSGNKAFTIRNYVENQYKGNAAAQDNSLPPWIYICTTLILFCLTLAVFSCLKK